MPDDSPVVWGDLKELIRWARIIAAGAIMAFAFFGSAFIVRTNRLEDHFTAEMQRVSDQFSTETKRLSDQIIIAERAHLTAVEAVTRRLSGVDERQAIADTQINAIERILYGPPPAAPPKFTHEPGM